MTKAQRQVIQRYVEKLQAKLELRDWTIKVGLEPCEDSLSGHILLPYGRKYATITLATDFHEETPEDQRHTLVHELVHCHLESPSNIIRGDLFGILGKQGDNVLWRGYVRQMEYAVDAIATVIAPHMPLPEFG